MQENKVNLDRLSVLSRQDVCNILKITTATLDGYRKGRVVTIPFPAPNIGKRWSGDVVEKWINDNDAARKIVSQKLQDTTYTIYQAADYLGVSSQTVYRYRRTTNGGVPFPEPDSPGPRWLKETIHRWAEANHIPPNPDNRKSIKSPPKLAAYTDILKKLANFDVSKDPNICQYKNVPFDAVLLERDQSKYSCGIIHATDTVTPDMLTFTTSRNNSKLTVLVGSVTVHRARHCGLRNLSLVSMDMFKSSPKNRHTFENNQTYKMESALVSAGGSVELKYNEFRLIEATKGTIWFFENFQKVTSDTYSLGRLDLYVPETRKLDLAKIVNLSRAALRILVQPYEN